MKSLETFKEFSFLWSSVSGNYLGTSATDTKDKLDLQGRELSIYLNSIIDLLISQDGSDYIGALDGGVKKSIQDILDKLNSNATLTNADVTYLKNTFNSLIINSGNSNAEIVAMRTKKNGTTFATSGARIDDVDSNIVSLSSQLSTSYNPFTSPQATYINLDNLGQFLRAIATGNCTVAGWGDSIMADGDQADFNRKFFDLYCEEIKTTFPTVNFTFKNFGIGGKTIEQAASSTFISTTDFNKDSNLLVWREYIKQAQPDLLFIHFGMNGVLDTINNKNSIQAILDFLGTFTKVPSVVFLTNMLPRNEWIGDAGYNNRLECMRSTREYVKFKGLTLFDVGYVYDNLVRGLDYVNLLTKKYTTFDKNCYLGTSNEPSKTFTSTQMVYTNDNIYNSRVTFTYTPVTNDGNQVIKVRLRSNIDIFLYGHSRIKVINTKDGATLADYTDIGLSTSYNLDIKIIGAKLTIICNNATKELYCFHTFLDAPIFFVNVAGTNTISNLSTYIYYPTPITPTMSIDDTFSGYVQNDFTLKLPNGGNGVNHPTSRATYTMYINHIKKFCEITKTNIPTTFFYTVTTFTNGWTGSCVITRKNNVVTIVANIKGGTVGVANGQAFSIPIEYMPTYTIDVPVTTDAGTVLGGFGNVRVNTADKTLTVTYAPSLTTSQNVRINITYIV